MPNNHFDIVSNFKKDLNIEDQIIQNQQKEITVQIDKNTYIYAGEGNTQVTGGKGDDLLEGGPGIDFLSGGEGNDGYIIQYGDPDYISDRIGKNYLIVIAAAEDQRVSVTPMQKNLQQFGGSYFLQMGSKKAELHIGNSLKNIYVITREGRLIQHLINDFDGEASHYRELPLGNILNNMPDTNITNDSKVANLHKDEALTSLQKSYETLDNFDQFIQGVHKKISLLSPSLKNEILAIALDDIQKNYDRLLSEANKNKKEFASDDELLITVDEAKLALENLDNTISTFVSTQTPALTEILDIAIYLNEAKITFQEQNAQLDQLNGEFEQKVLLSKTQLKILESEDKFVKLEQEQQNVSKAYADSKQSIAVALALTIQEYQKKNSALIANIFEKIDNNIQAFEENKNIFEESSKILITTIKKTQREQATIEQQLALEIQEAKALTVNIEKAMQSYEQKISAYPDFFHDYCQSEFFDPLHNTFLRWKRENIDIINNDKNLEKKDQIKLLITSKNELQQKISVAEEAFLELQEHIEIIQGIDIFRKEQVHAFKAYKVEAFALLNPALLDKNFKEKTLPTDNNKTYQSYLQSLSDITFEEFDALPNDIMVNYSFDQLNEYKNNIMASIGDYKNKVEFVKASYNLFNKEAETIAPLVDTKNEDNIAAAEIIKKEAPLVKDEVTALDKPVPAIEKDKSKVEKTIAHPAAILTRPEMVMQAITSLSLLEGYNNESVNIIDSDSSRIVNGSHNIDILFATQKIQKLSGHADTDVYVIDVCKLNEYTTPAKIFINDTQGVNHFIFIVPNNTILFTSPTELDINKVIFSVSGHEITSKSSEIPQTVTMMADDGEVFESYEFSSEEIIYKKIDLTMATSFKVNHNEGFEVAYTNNNNVINKNFDVNNYYLSKGIFYNNPSNLCLFPSIVRDDLESVKSISHNDFPFSNVKIQNLGLFDSKSIARDAILILSESFKSILSA